MKALRTVGLLLTVGFSLAISGCRNSTTPAEKPTPMAEAPSSAPATSESQPREAVSQPAAAALTESPAPKRAGRLVRNLDFSAKWPARYKGLALLVVRNAKAPPTIDGNLSDQCWKDSRELVFKHLDGSEGDLKFKTTGRIAADRDNLYLAWTCFDSDMSGLVANIEDADGNVWEDDDVEAFLLPSHDDLEPYFQLILNSVKTQFDSFDMDADSWNPKGVETAVSKGKDRWSVEVKIPFKDMNVRQGKTSRLWHINLTRSRPVRGDDEQQEAAWSPTEDQSNHVPEKFAYVLFEAIEGPSPKGLKPE